MIRAAGNLFRLGAYKPAARPTVFVFGRKSLLAGDGMNIAGSYGIQGMDMAQTTYQYGSRVRIDPSSDEDQVLGPVVKFEDRNTHNPYSPTEELCFDWKKGYLSLEASSGVSWTGLLGRVGNELNLKHGFTLSQVHIINPPGSFDPVSTEENYIAFSCYAQDGLPLRECKRASLSLVSTSFNSGFKLDLTKHSSGGHGLLPGAVTPGKLPVLVSRVGGVVCAPALAGMHYTVRDWHMKNLEQGIVGSDGRLVIKAEQPVFVIELVRP
jgi:hypothetical protein